MAHGKNKSIYIVVTILLCILVALLLLFFNNRYQNQCILYWDGQAYQFQDTYTETLPEDAVYLGEDKYIQYREGLGDDLTCNLIEISPDAKAMSTDDRRGQVYYASSTDRIFVAVNTEPHQDSSEYYFTFYR